MKEAWKRLALPTKLFVVLFPVSLIVRLFYLFSKAWSTPPECLSFQWTNLNTGELIHTQTNKWVVAAQMITSDFSFWLLAIGTFVSFSFADTDYNRGRIKIYA